MGQNNDFILKEPLKPCPFCGQKARLLMVWYWCEKLEKWKLSGGTVECTNWGCRNKSTLSQQIKKHRGKAVQNWNNRKGAA